MKSFLLLIALCGAPVVAQAQLLPVPGVKNPDWVLLKTEARPYDGLTIAPPSTDRMPNAAQKSISSNGNHHRYWDAERQLAYDWFSREGRPSVAPFELVSVCEQRKDVVYTYRRAK